MPSDRERLIEECAEELWQQDSLRAASRPRMVPWSEVDGGERDKWVGLAAAVLTLALTRAAEVIHALHDPQDNGWEEALDAASDAIRRLIPEAPHER